MVDSTASMGHYIQAVKDHISDMVRAIVQKFHNSKVRVGFVGYRDYTEGKERFEVLNITDNIVAFVRYMEQVKAYAGGDVPEDVLGALYQAIHLSWNAPNKIIFHIGIINIFKYFDIFEVQLRAFVHHSKCKVNVPCNDYRRCASTWYTILW